MKNIRATLVVFLAVFMIAAWCGCGRDVRLAGAKVRHVKVGPATHYGVTLDQSATPEQVAYVALRAIHDDFFASDRQGREAAIDIQFDVAAAEVMAARNKTSLQNDEYIHHVVTRWTPTVSHYSGDFESDADKAMARFKNRGQTRSTGGDILECELAMEVNEPGKDPAGRAVMLVWLAKDGGFWRVVHLGFDSRRALASAAATNTKPEGS